MERRSLLKPRACRKSGKEVPSSNPATHPIRTRAALPGRGDGGSHPLHGIAGDVIREDGDETPGRLPDLEVHVIDVRHGSER